MSAIQQVLMAGGKALPLFVSAGAANRVSGPAAITLAAPGTISNGDRLIAFLFSETNGQTLTSVPAGFSEVITEGSANNTVAIYEKTASGESGDYTFTWSAGAGGKGGVVVCYRSVNTLTVGAVGRANSATDTAPGISPSDAGILCQFFAIEATATVSTPPSGTSRGAHTASAPSFAMYDIDPQAAGATGDKTLIWSGSNQNAGILLQLSNV